MKKYMKPKGQEGESRFRDDPKGNRMCVEAWEKQHAWQMHAKAMQKKKKMTAGDIPMTKDIPGMPFYRYVTIPTHIDDIYLVECEACKRKAIRKSLGMMRRYDKLIKRYGAEFVLPKECLDRNTYLHKEFDLDER